MKATDDLFHLIKSMTGPEKGYFKKQSSLHVLHGENVYIKLFDAIDNQHEYDEKKIKERFKKESFIKHLTVIKNYLFKQVTQSLVAYYEESKARIKIRELISTAEILYEKNLFKNYQRTLEKAKKLAQDHEETFLLHEIVALEKQIVYTDEEIGYIESSLKQSHKEERKIIHEIEYELIMDNFYSNMSLLLRKYGAPSNEKEKKRV